MAVFHATAGITVSGHESQVRAAGPAVTAPASPSGPVRIGLVPPPAEGYSARPETAAGLTSALEAGTTTVLVPARAAGGGTADWAAASGKTQLALALAESLWQSRGLGQSAALS